MDTVRRSSELALADFDRARTLFVQDQVGTQSAVDAAERAYNQAKDARDLLDQSLRTYPARLREAQSALDAAEAQAALARTRLERTEIRVDFDARIKQKNIERDQYAAPGAAALVLANDEALEISVPLDSRDAREWLEFAPADGDGGISWFGRPAPAVCVIHWTEDKDGPGWQGALDRVERFDETTRTVTVAIRITAEQARGGGGLPLVDGMFCEVAIPGKTMRHVFRLPRWAVSFEENVYLAVNGRLQVRKVETVRNQGEEVFVSSGLEAGDLVIVTRLVNPLPNSLVEIAAQESPGSAAGGPVEPVHAEKAQ